jgi:hypothetical protein
MKINYSNSVQVVTFSFLIVCFVLFSCQPNSTTQTSETDLTENQEIRIAEEKQEMEVSFSLSTVEDDINGPKSSISAMINGKKTQFAEAINCEVVEKDVYDSKNVPLDANWACACWWAGDGVSFYAKKMDTKVEIYKQEVYEEMKTEDEKWELIKTLE